MLKRSEFLAGFGASLFVLTQGATAQPMPGGVLRVGVKLSPTSMDPQFRLAGEQNLLRGCHARLIGMTPDGKPTPAIAQSWRAVGDGRAWEITLNPAAKFSDGSPITAQDVAFSTSV